MPEWIGADLEEDLQSGEMRRRWLMSGRKSRMPFAMTQGLSRRYGQSRLPLLDNSRGHTSQNLENGPCGGFAQPLAKAATRETWLAAKERRDAVARKDYFDMRKTPYRLEDLSIQKIMEERIKPGDPRL